MDKANRELFQFYGRGQPEAHDENQGRLVENIADIQHSHIGLFVPSTFLQSLVASNHDASMKIFAGVVALLLDETSANYLQNYNQDAL